MAEPTTAAFPAAIATAATLGGTVANQKTYVVSGAHSASIQTITTTGVISGITAPNYLAVGNTGEIIYFEGISGADFTSCTRGADGTVNEIIVSGAVLYHINVANLRNQQVREMIAIETELGINPPDVDDTVDAVNAAASIKIRLSHLANRLKQISGEANWYTDQHLTLGALYDDAEGDPAALGTVADGTSAHPSRRDHVHAHINYICIEVVDKDTLLTTGDGKKAFHIPPEISGMNLVYVHAFNLTPSAVGIPTFQIRNVTDGTDLCSTKLTIDATETGSNTAAVPAVIDTTKDDVVTNDIIAVDNDVSGDTTKGVYITVGFRLP